MSERFGELVVHLKGGATVAEVGKLEAGLLRLVASRAPQIALDLSELSCISSLAMSVLLTARRGIVRRGSRVRLVPTLQSPVREALQRSGILELFQESECKQPCETICHSEVQSVVRPAL
jgi:anti-anti-sigma factor